MDNIKAARFFIGLGRFFVILGFLALIGAWITQLTGELLMGMSQQHLFNDAIALTLLGIVGLFDGFLHSKGL